MWKRHVSMICWRFRIELHIELLFNSSFERSTITIFLCVSMAHDFVRRFSRLLVSSTVPLTVSHVSFAESFALFVVTSCHLAFNMNFNKRFPRALVCIYFGSSKSESIPNILMQFFRRQITEHTAVLRRVIYHQ